MSRLSQDLQQVPAGNEVVDPVGHTDVYSMSLISEDEWPLHRCRYAGLTPCIPPRLVPQAGARARPAAGLQEKDRRAALPG